MKKMVCFLFLFLMAVPSFAGNSNTLAKGLSYLTGIPEVSWVIYKKNNVYIGFNTYSVNLGHIVNVAAVRGNKAYGEGIHVWAGPADNKDWVRPEGEIRYYCSSTARYGKITETNCKQ